MPERQRVLILGAGFGGVYAAKHLARLAPVQVSVEIVDDNNYFVFQPLLPEVAGGSVNAADAVTPLRFLLPRARSAEAEVVGVDFAAREVEVVQGMRRRLRRIPYDHLVLALGQVTDLGRYPGLPEHALTMKDLPDAFRLRNHVIDCLEQADIAEDAALKRCMLTFVVIGGGLSGVETIGEVDGMLRRALKFYPRIRREEVRLVLVEYLPRILPEVARPLADYAFRELQRRGVEILTGLGVRSAARESVELTDGRVIEAFTVVATIGNGPTPLVRALPLPKEKGRIVTDRFLRVPGFAGVWALGDAARIPLADAGDPLPTAPPTAQAARQEAAVLARNIRAAITGEPLEPFSYHSRGQLASLGARRGVADLFGLQVTGFLGWVLWRSVYLGLLPGWTTRVRIAVDWTLDTIFPRNLVQIQQPLPQAVRRHRFRAGDVVFRRGEVTGPLYLVLEGAVALDEGVSARTVGRGGHFGRGVLKGERLRRHTARALEDTVCLVFARDDLDEFATSLEGLRGDLGELARLRDSAS